jgi:carboxypeptidase D
LVSTFLNHHLVIPLTLSASSLLKTNKLPGFNLAGLAIGNGWIDPIRQYPAYAEFAYTKGLVQKGTDAGKALEAELAKCNEAIAKITNPELAPVNIFGCEGVMEMVRAPFRQE